MKRALLIGWSLVFVSGCALLRDVLSAAAKAFQQPSFIFKNVALTDITLAGLNLDTVWDLSNPNTVGISLAEVDYALFIENKQVVAGHPPNGLSIGAYQTSELHFPAAFKFIDLVQVVQTFLNQDTATWRAEGHLGVSTPIGVIRLPLAKDGTFEVPKVPALQFQNPRVSGLSLSGATIEFPLNVTNKNTYALPVGNVSGTLSIAGAPVGTISTGNLGDMSGKGTREVTIPLTINFFQAAGAAANAVRGGNAQVTFQAQVQSGSQSVPLRLDQVLTFQR